MNDFVDSPKESLTPLKSGSGREWGTIGHGAGLEKEREEELGFLSK